MLITGGAGFIGYHLANKLLESNYQIDILDNFSRGVNDTQLSNLAKNKNISLINADLLPSGTADKFDRDYTYIYHLAAVIGVQHVLKSPYDVLEKNFILLKNAFKIARKQKKLERFIFASTSEVYAGTLSHYGLSFPTPESTPLTISNLQKLEQATCFPKFMVRQCASIQNYLLQSSVPIIFMVLGWAYPMLFQS